jgi:nucleotide-binding universal stress UspA family protein
MIEYKRILCPTDFSDASLEAFPYAIELAQLFDADLFFIYVVPILAAPATRPDLVSSEALLREDAAYRMESFLRGRIPNNIRSSNIIAQGHAAEEILRAADNYSIDLITIATHGFTGWNHLICGSVAEKVVRMANVPVMTVSGKVTAEKRDQEFAEQFCSH